MDSSLDYCRESLERSDYPHYLVSLLMPAGKRPALWTLGAFRNVIESIPASVSEPALGYMRLTWWRDQVDLLAKGEVTKGQPVLHAISVMAREQRDRGNQGFLDDLKNFINEQESVIENPHAEAASAAYPDLLEKILGNDFTRYRALEDKLTAIMKKHHGTKWERNPPFIALRLWLASVTS